MKKKNNKDISPREIFDFPYDHITKPRGIAQKIKHLASFPQLNPSPVFELDSKGALIYANKATYDLLEKNGRKDDIGILLPTNINEVIGSLKSRDKETHNCEIEIRNMIYSEAITYVPQTRTIRVYAVDITQHKRDEEKLQLSEQKCKNIIQSSIDGLLVINLEEGRVLDVNEAYCKMVGYPRDELLKMNIGDINVVDTPNDLSERLRKLADSGHGRYETRHRCNGGRIIDVEISANCYKVEGKAQCYAFIRDITDRKWMEKELADMALKDSHTGLFSHRYLKDALESGLARAKREYDPLSVIMMDLDYFKSINDVYGHLFGDLVLKQFASELKKIVRPYDDVIRYGGEEFIIVSSGTNRAGAIILARRILESVNLDNFGDSSHAVKLKLSLAVVSYPEDNVLKPMDLVGTADNILNKVKEAGGNRVYSSLDLEKPGAKAEERSDVNSLKIKIEKLKKRANQSLIEAIFAFAKTIDAKDHYTGEHSDTSAYYAVKMAQRLNLSREQIEIIRQAALLHDLGKIGVSERILRKRSKLNEIEFEEIRKHPLIAVDIMRPIQSLHPVIPFVLYHHERWDGEGYPQGLRSVNIPLGARIISIADTYQALISNRSYRKAFSRGEAEKIIENGRGSQFDPELTDLFLSILRQEN